MPKSNPVVIITGPTACGKTSLALAISKNRPAEILNADSMQVYKDLSILTARPPFEDAQECPHRLYGFLEDPNKGFSVAAWKQEVEKCIKEAFLNQRLPIVVGGTGLYLHALIEGLAELPPVDPSIRADLRKQLQEKGISFLYKNLQHLDPLSAQRVNPQDKQRILRALEVIHSTGKSLSLWQQSFQESPKKFNFYIILINPPRSEIIEKAAQRLHHMFKGGALEEVKRVLDKGLDPYSPLYKALGVREIQAYLDKEIPLEKAFEKTLIATRQFIKRQQTWFKKKIHPDFYLDHFWNSYDLNQILERIS